MHDTRRGRMLATHMGRAPEQDETPSRSEASGARAPELDDASRTSDAPTLDPVAGAPRKVDPAWPRVGRFELLRRLGTGAMGVVYEAHDPTLDRAVAVKVLHAEMPRAARQRMQREALSLAKLSHPNVVQVFEVGEDDGRTFIAMELVRGRTLEAWAKRVPRPTWRECLAVYGQAGEGLQAAHAAGLVHRDLKPSNCMLGDDGRVRVLDFGLAKAMATDAEDEASASATRSGGNSVRIEPEITQGALLGTPAYMAPEQLSEARGGTAADQFSLCASLWEALHGQRPFVGGSFPELSFRILRGELSEPPRDARVPRWLRAVLVRGLSVDPQRRWPSVRALLDAIERGRSRARWRRGATALAVVGAVVLAVAGLRWYDEQQRTRACEAEGASIQAVWNDDVAAATAAALVGTGLPRAEITAQKLRPWLDAQARAWQDARTEACLDARVRGTWDAATLERAQWCLDERRMELEALVSELGEGRPRSVDMAVKAASELGRLEPCLDAIALARRSTPAPDQREAVQAVWAELQRAEVLQQAAAYDEGLALAREGLRAAQQLAQPSLVASARLAEGGLLEGKGEFAAAEAALEDAFFTAIDADALEVAAAAAERLVYVVGVRLERHADALRWSRHVEVLVAKLPDPERLRTAGRLSNLALVRAGMGEHVEAQALHERALALREQALGGEHPDVASSLGGLANVHRARGAHAEAKALYERARSIDEHALGPEHPRVAMDLNHLALVHNATGEYAEAAALHERVLALRERTLGPEHPDVARSLSNLGTVDVNLGAYDRAMAHHERALRIRERALGPGHPDVAASLANLAAVHLERGDPARAEVHLQRALAIIEAALGSEHPQVGLYLNNLASVQQDLGRHEAAKALLERAVRLGEATYGPDHQHVAASLVNLAVSLGALDRCHEAIPLQERALAIAERRLGSEHPDLAVALVNLAECRVRLGDRAGAEAALTRALRLEEAGLGPDHPHLAFPLMGLAELARHEGRSADAVSLLERALRLREQGEAGPALVAQSRMRLAEALSASSGDRARARSLAEAVRDACGTLGERGLECSREAEAWLAEHGR